jgi:histidyl-tRNA synthetase
VYNIPRGTRDFTPEEMQKRRYVETSLRTTFQIYGYREIQTPTFETLELFTAKSGDAIIDEIYMFTDKSGRELALRPELTAPVIRFYVDKLQMEPKPLKLFYFGNCYRYDRPQQGRYREFQQAGCELIGPDTPEAYAELIALAYQLLQNTGLKNIALNIGNLDVLTSIFTKLGVSKNDQKLLTPLIDKSQFDEVLSMLSTMNIGKQEAEQFVELLQTSDISKIQNFIKGDTVAEGELSDLEKILKLLQNSFGIKNYTIKMSIVRGLDYYKGLVFEIEAPPLGAEKQLCGGGAYELVPLFEGTPVPTAGFAIGFDRAILALEAEKFDFPPTSIAVYIIPVNEDMIPKALEIAQTLRNAGITTDVDIQRRGVGKNLKYANTLNAQNAILIGPKELDAGSITIRDMETGEQQLVKIKDIVSKIKNT